MISNAPIRGFACKRKKAKKKSYGPKPNAPIRGGACGGGWGGKGIYMHAGIYAQSPNPRTSSVTSYLYIYTLLFAEDSWNTRMHM